MEDLLKVSESYSTVLGKTVEANNRFQALLREMITKRAILRKELGGDALQCSVCMDRPKTRALTCGHLFCNTCTARIMGSDPARCPTCRTTCHRSFRVYISS